VAPPSFAPTQEIRFAVVMYGGVSLAIYINGVAQELLSLVRATAPDRPWGSSPAPSGLMVADADLKGTEAVYRELGRLLQHGRKPAADAPVPEGPVTTRFIVDVVSGTSAGGINGVYLAKALANEQPMEGLKRLWVEEGDIALLVNDAESYRGLEGLATQRPPESALNSKRMYWKLLAALDDMDAAADGAQGASRLVDELDLWITTTDLRGVTVPIDLFDRFVFEKRHRKVFRFLYGSEHARGGSLRNDFVGEVNPFLAFAARCTSAFPFAFEPMQLRDMDQVLGTDTFRATYGALTARNERWRGWFDEYLKAGGVNAPADADAVYRTQSFADGGYLDNKPFTWATGTLDRRRADLPVDRRLIYVEPDPGAPRVSLHRAGEEADEEVAWRRYGPVSHIDPRKLEVRPNALENALLAITGIPRYEAIREDLEAIVKRNREIDRAETLAALVDDLEPNELPAKLEIEEWRKRPISEVIAERGIQYAAYHRLKVNAVSDDLAMLVTRVAGFDEESDEYSAVRCFVEAWVARRHPPEGSGEQSQSEFLFRYDLSYRLRRIDYLQARVDDLLEVRDALEHQLRAVKIELSATLTAIRAAGRRLRSRDEGPLREAVAALGLRRGDLRAVLDGAESKADSVKRAADRLRDEPTLLAGFDAVAKVLRDALAPVFDDARAGVLAQIDALPPGPARARLQRGFDYYEVYDSVRFTIGYGHVGEADRVEVIRVSPHDATAIIDETRAGERRRKLAGTEIHHFGGFFDRAWRRNDLLWGRLDGAERIITTLLPEGPTCDALVRKAHLSILEEEFVAPGQEALLGEFVQVLMRASPPERAVELPATATEADRAAVSTYVGAAQAARMQEVLTSLRTPEQILDFLRTGYEPDRRLDARSTLRTTGRATRVTGEMLDGIGGSPLLKRPLRWAIRGGRLAVGLAEAVTPRSFTQLLLRYWLQVLLLAAVLMILGGTILGAPATAKAGWVLAAIVFGGRVVLWIVRDLVAPPARRVGLVRRFLGGAGRLALALVVVAVLGLAALEVTRHLDEDVDRAVCSLPESATEVAQDVWPWDDGVCPP
jgi:patatin-related protein